MIWQDMKNTLAIIGLVIYKLFRKDYWTWAQVNALLDFIKEEEKKSAEKTGGMFKRRYNAVVEFSMAVIPLSSLLSSESIRMISKLTKVSGIPSVYRGAEVVEVPDFSDSLKEPEDATKI